MATTTINSSVSPSRIAEILRSARNLMNNNGRHWVKGTEKADLSTVNPVTRYEEWFDLPIAGEYAYCSTGAIKEVVGDDNEEYRTACIELARIISEEFILEDAMDDYKHVWYENHDYDYTLTPPKPTQIELYDYISISRLNDTIAENNDAENTTWKDVSGWFTRAAARVSKRKGK